METTDSLMNLREAAAYLKISHRTLYEWVRLKKVPVERVGRGLRFRRTTLDAWTTKESVRG